MKLPSKRDCMLLMRIHPDCSLALATFDMVRKRGEDALNFFMKDFKIQMGKTGHAHPSRSLAISVHHKLHES